MFKRVLTITSLSIINTSLYAMDLNETTVIINEANKATQELQDEFHLLIDETSTPPKVEHIDVVPSITINKSGEINMSSDSTCNEKNSTITDNNCSNIDLELGSAPAGLIIYKTQIKPYCEMRGNKFAKQYTQEDWEDIYHDEEFKMELLEACPKMKERYEDKWTPDLYQFALEYASDSDSIPEC
jgi:hypothetical protein